MSEIHDAAARGDLPEVELAGGALAAPGAAAEAALIAAARARS
jgi:hypothetical protein